ncbi:hypothetical protein EAG_05819 [Camponotus floridanus]|uniref:Uncharacterized protein n=1 Tax=Camponotus floridanus TaxID=104421 RepID=E2AZN5_CAMFO|nr:hypothetical protein EAG_05819 [Camponotus floridanus]
MRSKQQPRPSFRWPQQRGDNLTVRCNVKLNMRVSNSQLLIKNLFLSATIANVLQNRQPIFEGPSMSIRPFEETTVDAQASSPLTALICRTAVLISTKRIRRKKQARDDWLRIYEEELLKLGWSVDPVDNRLTAVAKTSTLASFCFDDPFTVLNPSPSFAQNLNSATRENVSRDNSAYLVVMMDEFLGHVMKRKIIVNIYSPLKRYAARKILFPLCRGEYQYNPFPSFYLRS